MPSALAQGARRPFYVVQKELYASSQSSRGSASKGVYVEPAYSVAPARVENVRNLSYQGIVLELLEASITGAELAKWRAKVAARPLAESDAAIRLASFVGML